MTPENKINNISKNLEGLDMYFSPEIAEKFAALEQNEKNFRVAEIVDRTLMQETANMPAPLYVAELGGGAHPDRYHEFFNKLLTEPKGRIDWVDISPLMLELAEKYISEKKYEPRKEIISFVASDILEYLQKLEDKKLDLVIMKYTIDHIKNLDELFELLSLKLKPGGKVVSTIGSVDEKLKSIHSNARFLYNGEEFPEDEVKIMKDGDNFTIKFFNVSGDPKSGYLEGAEILKYFHSADKIRELANKHGFEIFLGDWKKVVRPGSQGGEIMDQEVLVLTKK
jgi:ubiquinone/menaquinone biosynthesis C-methylase UbiE